MKKYAIHTHNTGKLLFQGSFPSFNDCLEQAVVDSVCLNDANLQNLNLTNICLDDGVLKGADFSGSNLSGANLSKSELQGAKFHTTDLYNSCFAYAKMDTCIFENASFGGTEIVGADISLSVFSTLSCFSLDFSSAAKMDNCRFINEEGQNFFLSQPPVVIKGLGRKIIVFAETSWMHGTAILPYPEQFHPIPYLLQKIQITG